MFRFYYHLFSVSQMLSTPSNSTIEHLVLRAPHATVLISHGDGFGSYIQRLINVAHETHQSFADLLQTTDDLIVYLRDELDRTYSQYQFTIIVGKEFDYDQYLTSPSALIEHTGVKILIFSSIGTTYRYTTTETNEFADNKRVLSW